MKTLLVSAALLGLLAGAAGAQDAAPVPGAPAPVAGKPAAPPPPPGGPTPAGAPMPGPRGDRGALPPPPPSPAAHFRLESGGAVLDVKCADAEPMQACAQIALQFLDRASIGRTSAPAP